MFDSLSKAWKKRFNGFAASFLLLLAVAAVVGVFEFGEIGARDYRAVRAEFHDATPAFRLAVAQATNGGKISRWDYRKLTQEATEEKHPPTLSTGYAYLAEERLFLVAKAKSKQVQH